MDLASGFRPLGDDRYIHSLKYCAILGKRAENISKFRSSVVIMDTGLTILIFVFGIMGFGTNLLFRGIYLFCEVQDGNEINWKYQAMVTLMVPCAYLLAMLEIMLSEGILVVP